MRRPQGLRRARWIASAIAAIVPHVASSNLLAMASPPQEGEPGVDWVRHAAEATLPAVVSIVPVGEGRFKEGASGGSGVVIDASRGHVLTTDRVVSEILDAGGGLAVVLPDHRTRSALDLRRDPSSGLALLAIDPDGLDLVALAQHLEGSPARGDPLLLVGRPPERPGIVTSGIVAGEHWDLPDIALRDLFPVDAAVVPGAIGGAVVGADGGMIGILAAIGDGPRPLGFAIPAARASRVASDLREFGEVRRSAIGVSTTTADPERLAGLGYEGAALVAAVDPNGPAARADLRVGDLIVSASGRAIEGPERLRDVIEFSEITEPVALAILREDQPMTLKVRPEALETPIATTAEPSAIAERPSDHSRTTLESERPRLPLAFGSRDPSRLPDLGLRLGEPSDALAKRFGIDPNREGVVIVGVTPEGPADLGGLVPGMVITDLRGRRVASIADFRAAVATSPASADLILRVVHRGRSEFRVILRSSSHRPGDPPF